VVRRAVAHTLLEHDLVDGLRLKIFLVVLGAGDHLFGETSDKKPMRLLTSRPSKTASPTSPTSPSEPHNVRRMARVPKARRRSPKGRHPGERQASSERPKADHSVQGLPVHPRQSRPHGMTHLGSPGSGQLQSARCLISVTFSEALHVLPLDCEVSVRRHAGGLIGELKRAVGVGDRFG
jgi:hypothetical protein